MMSKEEIINQFDKLEHDILILQQMLAMRNDILELIDTDKTNEQDEVQNKFDELDDQLQIVVLY